MELPPFSRSVEPVGRLQIQLFNDCGYPFHRFVLPGHVVSGLPDVLKAAQKVDPSVDAEALFRTVLRLGLNAVTRMSERGVPIRPGDVPPLRAARDEELKSASSVPDDRVSGLRQSRC